MRRNNIQTFFIVFLSLFFLTAPTLHAAKNRTVSKHGLWLEYASPKDKPNTQASSILAQSQQLNRSLANSMISSVVNIYTTTKLQMPERQFGGPGGGQNDLFQFFFEEFFKNYPGMPPPGERELSSLGSGFIIHTDGYIVTNAHVIQKADVIKVKLDDDKRNKQFEFDAKIIGADLLSDIALLKIEPKVKLKVAPLGDSDKLQVGDYVMAIGNPFGHGHTVTQGIVSAMGRELDQLSPMTSFIQTDASINPGNSGGPLVNIHGEVVAINSAIDARGAGIGFALPINKAKKILADLKERGKVTRGWIGIVIGPEIDEKWRRYFNVEHGIIVSDTVPNQPAEKAGVQKNDVITHFNGKMVRSGRDILNFVAEVPVGKKVPAKVWRKGKSLTVNITVADRGEQEAMDFPQKKRLDPRDNRQKDLGIEVGNLSPDIRNQFRIPEQVKGVMVMDVTWNSPSGRAGLQGGDIIEKVNGRNTPNVSTFNKTINEYIKRNGSKNGAILFNVVRNSKAMPILVEIH